MSHRRRREAKGRPRRAQQHTRRADPVAVAMLVVAILALLVGFLAWRFPVAPPDVPPWPATMNSAATPSPVTSSAADTRMPSEGRIGRTHLMAVGLLGRQLVDISIGIDYVGDSGLLFDLFDGDEVGPGSTVTLEDGTTITYDTAYMTKGFDATQWINLAVQIPGAVVSAAVVVGWLMKHGPTRERVKKTTPQHPHRYLRRRGGDRLWDKP